MILDPKKLDAFLSANPNLTPEEIKRRLEEHEKNKGGAPATPEPPQTDPAQVLKDVLALSLEVDTALEKAQVVLNKLSDKGAQQDFEDKIGELKRAIATLKQNPTTEEKERFEPIFSSFKETVRAAEDLVLAMKELGEANPEPPVPQVPAYTIDDLYRGWETKHLGKDKDAANTVKQIQSVFSEYRSLIREIERKNKLVEFNDLIDAKKKITELLSDKDTLQEGLTEISRFTELLREAKEKWKEFKDKDAKEKLELDKKTDRSKRFDESLKQLEEITARINNIFYYATHDQKETLVDRLARIEKQKGELKQKRGDNDLTPEALEGWDATLKNLDKVVTSVKNPQMLLTGKGQPIVFTQPLTPEQLNKTLEEKIADFKQQEVETENPNSPQAVRAQEVREEMKKKFEEMYGRDPQAFLKLYLTESVGDNNTPMYVKKDAFLKHPYKDLLHFFFIERGIIPQDPPKLRPAVSTLERHRMVYRPGKKVETLSRKEKEEIAQIYNEGQPTPAQKIIQGREYPQTSAEEEQIRAQLPTQKLEKYHPQMKDMTPPGPGKEPMAKAYERVSNIVNVRSNRWGNVRKWALYSMPTALVLGASIPALLHLNKKENIAQGRPAPTAPAPRNAPPQAPVASSPESSSQDTEKVSWTEFVAETKMDASNTGLKVETARRYNNHWREDIKSPSPMALLQKYAPVFCSKWNNPAEACAWALDSIISDVDEKGNYIGNTHNLQEYQRTELSYLIKALHSTSMATSGQPLQSKKLSDAILEVRSKVLDFEKQNPL